MRYLNWTIRDWLWFAALVGFFLTNALMWKRNDNNFQSIHKQFIANINVNYMQSCDIVVLEKEVTQIKAKLKNYESPAN